MMNFAQPLQSPSFAHLSETSFAESERGVSRGELRRAQRAAVVLVDRRRAQLTGSSRVMLQDFEKPSAQPTVWVVNIPNENGSVKLSTDQPHAGKQCLKLRLPVRRNRAIPVPRSAEQGQHSVSGSSITVLAAWRQFEVFVRRAVDRLVGRDSPV